jgi:hypothetical protein
VNEAEWREAEARWRQQDRRNAVALAGHVLAFALAAAILLEILLAGCGPSSRATWQEPVTRWTRLPRSGNPLAIGASVASVASQDEAVAYIDGVVAGRLPGVRFYLVRFPALWLSPDGTTAGICTSYRDHQNGLVVLSWWGREGRPGRSDTAPPLLESGWTLGDAPWEVEHLIAGTDDQGRRTAW